MTPDQIAEVLSIQSKNEKRLWAAVILQALDDATGAIVSEGAANNGNIRRRARNWFTKGGKDFKEVCALAGMEHDRVRQAALHKIEEVGDGEIKKRAETIILNGERITIRELAARIGVSKSALHHRVKSGMTGDALTAPAVERKPVEITHNGETHTADEWSKITGIRAKTIRQRLKDGWTTQEALTPGRRVRPAKMTPHQKQRLNFSRGAPRAPKGQLHAFNGKSLTLRQWSNETGIPLNTLQVRLGRQGWSIEQALSTPLIDPSKRHAGVAARAARAA